MDGKNYFIYDGECPFCAAASKYYSVRDALGGVELVSMRDTEALRSLNIPKEINLDNGMVLILKSGELLQGEDAFRFINQVTSKRTILDKIAFPIFSSKMVMTFLYPVFQLMRRGALLVKGVSPKITR